MSDNQATLLKILDESRNFGITLTRAKKRKIAQEVVQEQPPKKKVHKQEISCDECDAAMNDYINMFESPAVLPNRNISEIAEIIFDSIFKNTIHLNSVNDEGAVITHFL